MREDWSGGDATSTGDEAGTTGDVQVDEALKPLLRLDDLPVHEHAAVVEEVHRALQGRLTGEDADTGISADARDERA